MEPMPRERWSGKKGNIQGRLDYIDASHRWGAVMMQQRRTQSSAYQIIESTCSSSTHTHRLIKSRCRYDEVQNELMARLRPPARMKENDDAEESRNLPG
jgi:hypothetical protein